MRCPKCGKSVERDAVICAGCEFILDTSFLGDDILDNASSLRAADDDAASEKAKTEPSVKTGASTKRTPTKGKPTKGKPKGKRKKRTKARSAADRRTETPVSGVAPPVLDASDGPNPFREMTGGFGEDALILGQGTDDEWESFEANDTGMVQAEVTNARIYVGGITTQLLRPDAIPGHTKGARLDGLDVTPFERHVFGLVNAKRPVGRIRRKSGLDDGDVKTALAMLADRGLIELAGIVDEARKKRARERRRKRRAQEKTRNKKPGDAPREERTRMEALPASMLSLLADQPAPSADDERLDGLPDRGNIHDENTFIPPGKKKRAAKKRKQKASTAQNVRAHEQRDDAEPLDDPTAFLKAAKEAEREKLSSADAALEAEAAAFEDAATELRPELVDESVVSEADVRPRAEADAFAEDAGAFFESSDVFESGTASGALPVGDDAASEDESFLEDSAIARLARADDESQDASAIEGLPASDALPRETDAADAGQAVEDARAFDDGSGFDDDGQAPTVMRPDLQSLQQASSAHADDAWDPEAEGADGDGSDSLAAEAPVAPAEAFDDDSLLPTGEVDAFPSAISIAFSEEGAPHPDVVDDDDGDLFLSGSAPPVASPPADGSVGGAAPPLLPADALESIPGDGPVSLPAEDFVSIPDDAAAANALEGALEQGALDEDALEEDYGDDAFDDEEDDAPDAPTASSEVSFEFRRKAEKIFEQATKDYEAKNYASARMNAKLASVWDPSVPAYAKAVEEWAALADEVAKGDGSKRRDVALFERAKQMEMRGKYKDAVKVLEEAIAVNPRAAPLYNRLGVIQATRLKDFKSAADNLIKACDLDPLNFVFKNNLGKILGMQERHAERGDPKKRMKKSKKGDDEDMIKVKKIRPKMF